MVSHIHPDTLEEALEYLKHDTYHIVGGGSDLWVRYRNWANTPPKFDKSLLYIAHLEALKGIKEENGVLTIGAETPYETILTHKKTPGILKKCLYDLASPAIRHIGTLAGNIANASPAADAVLALITLDATLEIDNHAFKRTMKVKDVITGPGKTTLESRDLITKIHIPIQTFSHETFKKIGGRKASAIAKVAFAGGADIKDGNVQDLNIALGAVNVTVVRDEALENDYLGKPLSKLKTDRERFMNALGKSIKPIDDQRSSAEYRKKVALNMISRFIDSL